MSKLSETSYHVRNILNNSGDNQHLFVLLFFPAFRGLSPLNLAKTNIGFA